MKRLSAREIKRRGIGGFECVFNPQLKIEASGEGGEKKLPSFDMLAYNGGKLGQWWGTCVVNLENIRIEPVTAILFNHDHAQPVGQGGVKNSGKQLTASGVISFVESSPAARQIVEGGKNGFPWQASIGGGDCSIDEVVAGETVTVNGQELEGPFYLLQGMPLKEISIVVNGADDQTATTIQASKNIKKGTTMGAPKKKGVMAKMFAFLQAAVDEENKTSNEDDTAEDDQTTEAEDGEDTGEDDETEEDTKPAAGAPAPKVKAGTTGGKLSRVKASADPVASMRAREAEEMERTAKIRKVCAGNDELAIKAVKEGWSVDKTELEVLRASRAPMINLGAGMPAGGDSRVLEAAVAITGRLPGIDKHYDDKTLSAAHKTYKGSIGLAEILVAAAASNGFTGRMNFKSDGSAILRAAFSGGDIQGLLSNIANKFLLAGFTAVESTWRAIAAIRNVSDFKEITSYALTADMKYELVGPGGKIQHGSLGEVSYKNRARTYAKMLSITRQDIINDNLGALTQVPTLHGRGAALAFNEIFWAKFLNNASFFSTGHKNYFSGADSALSIDSLTVAENMFLDQTDPDGNTLAVTPKVLLVPNALNTLGSQIMRSTELRMDGASAKTSYVTSNPHAGKFDTVRSSYLSNAKLTGYSAAAWYLLAAPQEMPVIEACFLDGKEVPTVETSEADFDTLGIDMRGFHDWGVEMQEYRGGVKSKGAA